MTTLTTPSLSLPVSALANAPGRFNLPEDGWVQVVPLGEFPAADGKVVQVLDSVAMTALESSFHAQEQSPNFPGLLVDFDHFSYDTEKSSAAAGWIMAVQIRPDGLYGSIRWTTEGEEAITGGNYRFLSPTFLKQDCQTLDGGRVRPLRLDSAGLTNKPNLPDQASLTNRQGSTAAPVADGPENPWPSVVSSDPAELARQRSEAVKQFQNRAGCDFETAWNTARTQCPALFNLTPHQASGRLQFRPEVVATCTGMDAAAVRRLEGEIATLKNRHGLTYGEARETLRSIKPELFGLR